MVLFFNQYDYEIENEKGYRRSENEIEELLSEPTTEIVNDKQNNSDEAQFDDK